jgi:hypothetical protein
MITGSWEFDKARKVLAKNLQELSKLLPTVLEWAVTVEADRILADAADFEVWEDERCQP